MAEDDSGRNYLPNYEERRPPPNHNDISSMLSSDYDFSMADESSIHTSDYASSSVESSSMLGETDVDTAFDGYEDPLAAPSHSNNSRSGNSEESSADWNDVTDSSTGSGGSQSSDPRKTGSRSSRDGSSESPIRVSSGKSSFSSNGSSRMRILSLTDRSRLYNVEYLSRIDVASSKAASYTEGPIRPWDAQSAFERNVPSEVPIEHQRDEMSSIGAVSRVPKRRQESRQRKEDPLDLERGIQNAPSLETLQALKEELGEHWASPMRSQIETFFIALIAISLVILVILLIILLNQRH